MIYTTHLTPYIMDRRQLGRETIHPSLPPTISGPEIRGQARIQLAGSARKLSCEMRDDEMVHIIKPRRATNTACIVLAYRRVQEKRRAENAHLALWFVHSSGRGDNIPQGSCCGWQGLVCRIAVSAHTSYRSRPWHPFLGMDTAWMNSFLFVCRASLPSRA